MSNGKSSRAIKSGRLRNDERRHKLRVLVLSSLPVTAAGLEALLRPQSDLEVTASTGDSHWEQTVRDTEADVLVLDIDEHESADRRLFDLVSRIAEMTPMILLVADPSARWVTRALRGGVLSILPHGVSGEELVSAVRAAACGLVTLSREILESIIGSPGIFDSDEFEFPAESLTAREKEVLAMIAEGLLNKEIASRLQISEHTVKFHISSIMGKLGASSRTEAVTRGIRLGLVFL